MGLTLVEALTNLLGRIDTPGVRMFARSIAQGETMGVSTGQIMRNLASSSGSGSGPPPRSRRRRRR